MKQAGGNEGDDPESDHDGSDGEDQLAHAPVLGVSGSSLSEAKYLPKETDDKDNAAEDDREQR